MTERMETLWLVLTRGVFFLSLCVRVTHFITFSPSLGPLLVDSCPLISLGIGRLLAVSGSKR